MLVNLWSLEVPVLCHLQMFKKSNIVKYIPLNVETYSYIIKNIVFPSQSVMIIKLKLININQIGNFRLSISYASTIDSGVSIQIFWLIG